MKFWIINRKHNKVFFNTLIDAAKYAKKNCKNNGLGYSVYDKNYYYICYMQKIDNRIEVIYPVNK